MLKEAKSSLAGKVVLVTGASRGIGKSIAQAFARQECRLVIMARNKDKLIEAAKELRVYGSEVLTQAVDLANEKALLTALEEVRTSFGNVDVLVNNAGVYKSSPVIAHPSELWHEIMAINLSAAFVLCRELAQAMIDSGWGRIINISSISGKQAEIHGAAYSASKFGLIALTQSLALELASKNITVNAICPGWVNTDMARQQLTDEDWCKLNAVSSDESLLIAKLSVPQLRFVEPEEVAHLALYLASDSAQGITGQAINICGGMCFS